MESRTGYDSRRPIRYGEFRTKSFSDEIEALLDSGVSLKEAKGNLELKMVQYAYEKYQSTYKVADALGISNRR